MNNYYQQPPVSQPQVNLNPTLPPIPEPPNPPAGGGWLKWVLIVLVVALISSGTTYFVMNQSQKPTPLPSEVSTKAGPTPTPGINFKTYTNTKYSFSFNYPEGMTLSIENDSESQFLLILKSVDEELAIEVSPATYGSFFLRGNPTIGTVTVNNIIWTIVPASEYCDAGSCGKVSPAYILKNNNWYYNLILRKISTASITFNQILSTFKFLK